MQDNAISEPNCTVPLQSDIASIVVSDSPSPIGPGTFEQCAQRLLQMYRNIRVANLAIGYLKSQLNEYQGQLAILSETEERSRRSSELELKTEEMMSMVRQSALVEELSAQNDALRAALSSERSPRPLWSAVGGLLFDGTDEHHSQWTNSFSMEDYYRMIQQRL